MTTIQGVDALAQSGELSIPLVISKKEGKENKVSYIGFIPGFLMKNIIADNVNDCKTELKNFLMNKLKQLMKNNEPFPFFPTKVEILKNYDNIESIDFIKVKSNNRKG